MKKTLEELKAMLGEVTELYDEASAKQTEAWNKAAKAVTEAGVPVPEVEFVSQGFVPTWVKNYEAAFFGETKEAFEEAREACRKIDNRRVELIMAVARAEAREERKMKR